MTLMSVHSGIRKNVYQIGKAYYTKFKLTDGYQNVMGDIILKFLSFIPIP